MLGWHPNSNFTKLSLPGTNMFIHDTNKEPVKIKSFKRGEVIYHENAVARFLYEVKNGEVQIVNSNMSGREFIQAIFKTGDCFGIPSLILGQTYPEAAIAYTDCEIYITPKEKFIKLLKEDYMLHFSITQMLCKQLLYTKMMLEEIAIEEGEHRLLTLIHYLMNQKDFDNRKLDITKQQLADMSGLRVETVIRIMKKVEDKGLIETKRGNIVCLCRL
jgi:CRP/FNR family cyclic AMP-dependent transcriptional regulator